MKSIRTESNRIGAYSQPGADYAALVASCERVKAVLKDELGKVEQALEQMVAQDEEQDQESSVVGGAGRGGS